ncbi:type II secretion system protein [Deinococcus cavernae]|uniref:Type II secretion system protein n=1 Tax=Deinococcus cavernae TaxID=2320857 RepID=A0A418VGL9_9DEIO|nr:prepilin-type N-terminal cleavage/methylation domain-containing protein [Deinococcus cavernae]RJF75276.1 type II secretion system protein [Deinococcus cavernae]
MRRAYRQGFTIIEILVTIAIVAIMVTVSMYLLTGLRTSPKTRQTLGTSQATSQWFENATNAWLSPANFGNLSLLTAVPAVTGATWSAQACEVDTAATPANIKCGASVTSGTPSYDGGLTTTTKTVVRLNLAYTPTGGSAVTSSLEFAKR